MYSNTTHYFFLNACNILYRQEFPNVNDMHAVYMYIAHTQFRLPNVTYSVVFPPSRWSQANIKQVSHTRQHDTHRPLSSWFSSIICWRWYHDWVFIGPSFRRYWEQSMSNTEMEDKKVLLLNMRSNEIIWDQIFVFSKIYKCVSVKVTIKTILKTMAQKRIKNIKITSASLVKKLINSGCVLFAERFII